MQSFAKSYEETVEDFFAPMLRLLRPGGRFSFCNMYQPFDAVRHVAYSLYLQSRLRLLGFSCSFAPIDILVAADTWHGLKVEEGMDCFEFCVDEYCYLIIKALFDATLNSKPIFKFK